MSYKEVEKAFSIPGMMWPRELFELHDLFRGSNNHIEVGSYCGRSLYAAAAGMADASMADAGIRGKHITAVDDLSLMSGQVPSAEWTRTVLQATIDEISKQFTIPVTACIASSETAAEEIVKSTSVPITSVFIDADHSQEMVARDIVAWWPVLKTGGIMAGHDYCHEFPGVMNAVNDIFQGHHDHIEGTRIWHVIKTPQTDSLLRYFKQRAVN